MKISAVSAALITMVVSCAAALAPAAEKTTQESQRANWALVVSWPDLMGGVWGDQGAGGPDPMTERKFPPPLTPAAIEARKRRTTAVTATGSRGCVPDGVPINVGGEFFYTKNEIFLMSDLDYFVVRQIHMDRSTHIDDPTYYGDSIGHWEGDALVVDTTSFLPEVAIINGVPGNGKTHLVERFHLIGPDQMEYTQIITNPDVLTRAWTIKRTFPLHRDWHVHETYCDQNNREMPINGKANLDLTPPK